MLVLKSGFRNTSNWLGPARLTVATIIGLTVIMKLTGSPVQVTPPGFRNEGVTVITATWGWLVPLVAIKLGIFPVPPAARPIPVLLLVQLKAVPGIDPVKLTATVDHYILPGRQAG